MNLIKFKRDTAFRKQFFVPDSFAHPAKMDAQLFIWLTEKFTKEGETILDPMFGSGTTMLACTLGRNVIGVELEQKFVDMAKANWEVVKMHPQLGCEMGRCGILQGDARNLEGLLADKVIFSPPYAETKRDDKRANDPEQIDKRAREFEKTGGNFHTPGRMATIARHYAGYTGDKDNIGNLPYGNIDSIITSPPYEGSVNVPDSKQDARAERLKKAGYDPKDYQGGKGRNLQQDWSYHPVDAVITSPPYEGTEPFADKKFMEREGKAHYIQDYLNPATNNIGNLRSDSYLSAMLQVYNQCFRVLKDNGLMILVTKNFIRNKKEVRLDEDTIRLCEQAGFKFQDRWYRELPAQSFWRIIYKQKYPDAPEIKFEDVLIFNKGIPNP